MRKMLASLSQMLFPHICICCNDYISNQEDAICDFCVYLLPKFEYNKDDNNQLNQLFWGRTQLENAAAYLRFKEKSGVQTIIHEIKYKKNKRLGILMGEQLGRFLEGEMDLSNINYLVPVPLHLKKERNRGYNQSKLLAQGISNICGIKVLDNNLVRVKNTSTQTQMQRYERHENMKGNFSVMQPNLFQDKHVLMVDDVITTGATIEACAQEIHKVGSVRISICSLAITD
jgi:ComF family protein